MPQRAVGLAREPVPLRVAATPMASGPEPVAEPEGLSALRVPASTRVGPR